MRRRKRKRETGETLLAKCQFQGVKGVLADILNGKMTFSVGNFFSSKFQGREKNKSFEIAISFVNDEILLSLLLHVKLNLNFGI